MDIAQRIAQFENMVQADPTNDMAHFSLGGAYAQAQRFAEAADSYLRCIQLNESMSKAYQLAGQYLAQAGDTTRAIQVLTDGFVRAGERGDRLPQKAMGELLTKLGAPVPEIKKAGGEAPAPTGGFTCRKTGRPGTQMDRPPFRGPLGEWIAGNISRETFNDWIAQGTKVINELRLDLSRDDHAETYDQHMREYLGIDDEVLAQIHSRPERP